MPKHVVTLIPGDGIGPSISDAVVKILDAAGAPIEWDIQIAGIPALDAGKDLLPESVLSSIRKNKVALKGPLTTPVGTGFRSINVALRQEFDLYANVRPTKTILPGGRYVDVDLVIVRENTEGLYIGIERWDGTPEDPKAAAESVMRVTRKGTERVIRYAFEHALRTGRTEVVLGHKANILKFTQGLMLEIAREIAKEYEGRVTFRDEIVDALCMKLVMRPEKYQVLVMENLFGDIVSDLCSGLVGGLGLAPGANIGETAAIFEAVHGSAPDIAGKNIANPSALLLGAVLMLEHLGEVSLARHIQSTLETVLREGQVLTPDLGGTATTTSFTDYLISRL